MDDRPNGIERRLVLRLLGIWRDARGENAFPSLADMRSEALDEIWPHAFLIDVADSGSEPVIREVGAEFATYCPDPLTSRAISETPHDTLAAEALSFVREVLERGVPVSRGGRFTGGDGSDLLYRSIVLPLSEDGERITSLIGAVNCRVLADL
jgi:hypothetical protein